MQELNLKLLVGKGLELFETVIYWGESLESIKSKLSPYYNTYHPSLPDISAFGSRFTNGIQFAHYHTVEINYHCATAVNFNLGFSDEHKLIEFYSFVHFDLETEFGNIAYSKKITDTVNELKLKKIELEVLDCGSILIKKYNIIIAKSPYKEPFWNKGDLIEYLYISE